MKVDKGLIAFVAILLVGLVFINYIMDWDKIGGKSKNIVDIKLPENYEAKVVLKGLKNPSSFSFDNQGNTYIAENSDNSSRIVKYTKEGKCTVIIDKQRQPISYLMYHRNQLYISQKGSISKLTDSGIVDLASGLPSLGDYSNNAIAYGYDGMIYICQGAATNSGIVGIDNFEKGWLGRNPYFHDYPPIDCILGGYNFKTSNPLSLNQNNTASTGAFLPFNTISLRSEQIKGRIPGNACILRLSSYGSIVDTFAWGIRNPVGIVILPDTRVFISAQGMEERGSRPVANGNDYIYELKKNQWLGWPDYEGGEPVTLKKFKSKKQYKNIQFLMELHPNLNPPKPIAVFKESGRIGYIEMNTNSNFGFKNNLFIPLKKGIHEAAKIVAFDIKTNNKTDFITNNDGKELISNPVQCAFSKEGKLYILENDNGVLLEIGKSSHEKESILPSSVSIEYFIGLVLFCFVLYIGVSVIKKK